MKLPCGCCAGVEPVTPLVTANRPGLSALAYRVGTHSTFFETMLARLAQVPVDVPADGADERGEPRTNRIYPLRALTTRDSSDPAIALLDAWATLGDVLAFYQERIANEGYLRTATERRSVLELARLVGYRLRPGVASSVFLAYTIEKDSQPVVIPAGARANSVPGPGEQMQAFETSEPIEARPQWNELKPRMARPQTLRSIEESGLYLQGTSTNLKRNDLLLIFEGERPILWRVGSVEPDAENKRTLVRQQGAKVVRAPVPEMLREIADRYRDTERFEVSRDTATAGRVLEIVDDFMAIAREAPGKLSGHLREATLPRLTEELQKAETGGFTKLAPWIAGLTADLRGFQVQRDAISAEAFLTSGRVENSDATTAPGDVVGALLRAPSRPPVSPLALSRSVVDTFAPRADVYPKLLSSLVPLLDAPLLYSALGSAQVTPRSEITVYALRVRASLFGHNAPLQPEYDEETKKVKEYRAPTIANTWSGVDAATVIALIALDAVHDGIQPDSYLAVDRPLMPEEKIDPTPNTVLSMDRKHIVTLHRVVTNRSATMSGLGLSAKVTQVGVRTAWGPDKTNFETFKNSPAALRETAVHAESELLTLADEPIGDPVCGAHLELAGLYDGLTPGRRLIVSGERSDIPGTSGVRVSELVMLAGVEQTTASVSDLSLGDGPTKARPLPGDRLHTFLTFSGELGYCYKRDTVTLHGNVVHATHGETRNEVLGAGDAAKTFQTFVLKQPPLTFVSAPTVSGTDSTLEVRVNDVLWHEAESLAEIGPGDRKYVTVDDDNGKASVIFGDGGRGARLPTGTANVKAQYRNGIGKGGNARAEQISLLATRPLGVKAVINPLRASGGADRESRDDGRRNAPLALMALDRLVSTSDYADFARTFAGIGKASAVRLTDGHQQLVHVAIAGVDDIPIDTASDLFYNLSAALRRYGDPYLHVRVALRELLALVISANARVLPDYQWESVEPKLRAALLEAFGFGQRDLGQGVAASELIAVMQRVPGVAYVDLDFLSSIGEKDVFKALTPAADAGPRADVPDLGDGIPVRRDITPRFQPGGSLTVASRVPRRVAAGLARVDKDGIHPAQLAYLLPGVPETLILNEVKS